MILIGLSVNLDVYLHSGCLILHCEIIKAMDSKITISKTVCSDEVVDYIASRYSITPQQVINHFMRQEGILGDQPGVGDKTITFEENEMAILRDMGIRPSCVEFIETDN